MNVGCAGTSSPSLLSNHCASLSLSPSLSLSRKKFRCAESYPRGVGSTIMATGRQGVQEIGGIFKNLVHQVPREIYIYYSECTWKPS